jgi:hypothetical protein
MIFEKGGGGGGSVYKQFLQLIEYDPSRFASSGYLSSCSVQLSLLSLLASGPPSYFFFF